MFGGGCWKRYRGTADGGIKAGQLILEPGRDVRKRITSDSNIRVVCPVHVNGVSATHNDKQASKRNLVVVFGAGEILHRGNTAAARNGPMT